jgi:hypothetical protein
MTTTTTFRYQDKLHELVIDDEYTCVWRLENTTFRNVTISEWTKEFDELFWRTRQNLVVRQVMQS